MKRYAVFGNPVKHSFSPSYFLKKFEQLKLPNYSYEAIEAGSPEEIIRTIRSTPLFGANITIPFKKSIIPFLDGLDPDAEAIGSVNCISIQAGELNGYNTDHYGFIESLKDSGSLESIKYALVLGDGGSAAAVKHALLTSGIRFDVVSRSGQLNYNTLSPSQLREADLVVNTTPLGMYPNVNECPDIPYQSIRPGQLFFDLVYRPEESLFLKRARLLGAKTINGLRMLELQADLSWSIWNKSD